MFYDTYRGNSNKNLYSPRITIIFIHLWLNCGEKALISFQNWFFGRRSNLSPYISCYQLAMFATWRPQKSLRRHKDPITGNFLNASVVLISYLNLVERSDFLFSLKSETSINDVRFGKCFSRLFKYLTGNGTFVDNRYKAFIALSWQRLLSF